MNEPYFSELPGLPNKLTDCLFYTPSFRKRAHNYKYRNKEENIPSITTNHWQRTKRRQVASTWKTKSSLLEATWPTQVRDNYELKRAPSPQVEWATAWPKWPHVGNACNHVLGYTTALNLQTQKSCLVTFKDFHLNVPRTHPSLKCGSRNREHHDISKSLTQPPSKN